MLTLLIEADGEAPRTVRVDRFPCRIGRGRDADVVLPGWRVGRIHAELQRIERGVRLVDAGTLAGTWVNGERIAEHGPLLEVDDIRIAGWRLRIVASASVSVGPASDAVRIAGGPALDVSRSTSRDVREAEHPSDRDASGSPHSVIGDASIPSRIDARFSDPQAGARFADPQAVVRTADRYSAGDLSAADRRAAPPAPPDTPTLEWRRLLHRRLLQTVDLRRRDIRQLDAGQLRAETRTILQELIDAEPGIPPELSRDLLREEVLDEAIGLGPLERLMADPEVSEIMVNSPTAIWVERAGRLERTPLAFSGEQAVRSVIDRIVAPVGRRIDEGSPMVDARLPDGSRVNAIVPPLAVRGAALTIRRFNRQVLAPDDLVALGSASSSMIALLRACVVNRRNIVISGGTGSGKTTLLNVLSNLVPESERIVTIEDAAELRLDHEHLVALEARPSNAEGRGAVPIRDLVRNALRMRPDRIVVGECRGGEALDMLQAMNTGHDGSLTTVHANSPRDVVARLETMVLMAGMDLPVAAIRDQIASAVHLIVQQARCSDGRRRIVELTEVTGLEGTRVLMQPIYRWESGRYRATGAIPLFVERLREAGMRVDWSPDDEHDALARAGSARRDFRGVHA